MVDSIAGDGACAAASGACTLRAAIQEASAAPGVDEVVVPAGMYTLSIPGRAEDGGATGDLDAMEDLVLTGAGAGATIIDASGLDRILHLVGGVSATLSGLGFTGGDPGRDAGGAILRGFGRGGILTLLDCRFTGNRGEGGGAVFCFRDGASRFERCEFDANMSTDFGGAIMAYGTDLAILDTSFTNNVAVGGGALATDVRRVTITRCRFHQNRTEGASPLGGGAFFPFVPGVMLVEDTSFTENVSADEGGAIWDPDGSSLTLRRVTISGCRAQGSGGGVVSISSPLVLSECTISGNEAGTFASGGGLAIYGGAILVNLTVSGNRARDGGGIMAGGSVQILNSTIAFNDAMAGAGISTSFGSSVAIGRSILAGNTGGSDCAGELASLGRNVFGSPTPCTITGDTSTDLLGFDPLLGPLQDNLGPTLTHSLLLGSPATDASADTCIDEAGLPLMLDQRGQPRPVDGDGDGLASCDAGAFEADCGGDTDGDTVGDLCDCAPGDAGSTRIPPEADLRVSRDAAADDAIVSWQDLASAAGVGTTCEVASDSIAALWMRRVADAPCIATGLPGSPWRDSRTVNDIGWCYLVRGVNACGPSVGDGWGMDSTGTPRPACP